MTVVHGRFDDKCPHCEVDVDVQVPFEAAEYSHTFSFECPNCEEHIFVNVSMVPEFELFDKNPFMTPKWVTDLVAKAKEVGEIR